MSNDPKQQIIQPYVLVPVLSNDFERDDYSFRYWIDSDGNRYYEETSAIFEDSITLSGVWDDVKGWIKLSKDSTDEEFIIDQYDRIISYWDDTQESGEYDPRYSGPICGLMSSDAFTEPIDVPFILIDELSSNIIYVSRTPND